MTDTALEEVIRQRLRDLGNTPREVADNLINVRCWGKPKNTLTCPVANFVRQIAQAHSPDNAPRYVTVGLYSTTVRPTFEDDPLAELALPRPVHEFIRRFDAGSYLELREL